MGDCKFCDMKFFDEERDCNTYEGEHIYGDVGFEIYLFDAVETGIDRGHAHTPVLEVNYKADFSKTVRYEVEGYRDEVVIPDNVNEWDIFEINFCPMCGRDLRNSNTK